MDSGRDSLAAPLPPGTAGDLCICPLPTTTSAGEALAAERRESGSLLLEGAGPHHRTHSATMSDVTHARLSEAGPISCPPGSLASSRAGSTHWGHFSAPPIAATLCVPAEERDSPLS